MRTCSHCKESKKDDEFYITKKKDDEHGSVIKDRKCKKCRIAYNGEWRRKKKQKIKINKEESSSNDISPDLINVLIHKLTILEEKVAKQEAIMNKTSTDLEQISEILEIDLV